MNGIFGFEVVFRREWELYCNIFGIFVMKYSSDGEFDFKLFWKLKLSELVMLYKLVLCYCIIIVGSYDVERLFFVYCSILGEK